MAFLSDPSGSGQARRCIIVRGARPSGPGPRKNYRVVDFRSLTTPSSPPRQDWHFRSRMLSSRRSPTCVPGTVPTPYVADSQHSCQVKVVDRVLTGSIWAQQNIDRLFKTEFYIQHSRFVDVHNHMPPTLMGVEDNQSRNVKMIHRVIENTVNMTSHCAKPDDLQGSSCDLHSQSTVVGFHNPEFCSCQAHRLYI